MLETGQSEWQMPAPVPMSNLETVIKQEGFHPDPPIRRRDQKTTNSGVVVIVVEEVVVAVVEVVVEVAVVVEVGGGHSRNSLMRNRSRPSSPRTSGE